MRAGDKNFIDFTLGTVGSTVILGAGYVLEATHVSKNALATLDLSLSLAMINVHIAGSLLMVGGALILAKCVLKHILTTTPS